MDQGFVPADKMRNLLIAILALMMAPVTAGAASYKGDRVEANITNDQLLIDTTGHLAIEDPFVHIPMGEVVGHESNNKFGRSQNVDATPTDIWDLANATEDQALWVRPTTNRVHEIYSNDTDDTGAGAGCRTVRVQGVGHGDFSVASETITMNGSGYVPTLNTYSRINRMNCETFGATELNEGDIFAIAQVDASSQAMITANFGQTLMAIWSCPLGHTCLITKYYASLNKSGGSPASADITLFARKNADNGETGWVVKHFIGLMTTGSTIMEHDFKPYFKVGEKTDIKVQALGSTTNLDVSAGFDIIEVLD